MVAHIGSISVARIAGDWHAPIGVVLGAVLATALFLQAFVRLRRRRAERAPLSRLPLFGIGLALAVLPLVSPLDAAGDQYLLSAHMLQHVLIGDAAPLFLVLAVRGPLAFFLLPPRVLRPLAASVLVRAALAFLLRPLVSFSLWAIAILAWHVPAAYDAALAHPAVHVLEHLSFVIAGTLVWMQLIDPARHGRLTRGGKIGFAFGLLVVGHPVADVLLFTPHAVYTPYAAQPHRLLGLGPVTDQRVAGAVMVAEQLLTLGSFVTIQLWPLLRSRPRRDMAVHA